MIMTKAEELVLSTDYISLIFFRELNKIYPNINPSQMLQF